MHVRIVRKDLVCMTLLRNLSSVIWVPACLIAEGTSLVQAEGLKHSPAHGHHASPGPGQL